MTLTFDLWSPILIRPEPVQKAVIYRKCLLLIGILFTDRLKDRQTAIHTNRTENVSPPRLRGGVITLNIKRSERKLKRFLGVFPPLSLLFCKTLPYNYKKHTQ